MAEEKQATKDSDYYSKREKDKIIETTLRYLADGGEKKAAGALVSYDIEITRHSSFWGGCFVMLEGPRGAYDLLTQDKDIIYQIRKALSIELVDNFHVELINGLGDIMLIPTYKSLRITPGWFHDLLTSLHTRRVDNQAVAAEGSIAWQGFLFNSETERRMARAFDKVPGVLFFPNCKARLGIKQRVSREPDFLVCYKGEWGILEVDGGPFHPPTRTVEDHKRDELFLRHGIKFVRHYDAGPCYKRPDEVVQSFLDLLEQQG